MYSKVWNNEGLKGTSENQIQIWLPELKSLRRDKKRNRDCRYSAGRYTYEGQALGLSFPG